MFTGPSVFFLLTRVTASAPEHHTQHTPSVCGETPRMETTTTPHERAARAECPRKYLCLFPNCFDRRSHRSPRSFIPGTLLLRKRPLLAAAPLAAVGRTAAADCTAATGATFTATASPHQQPVADSLSAARTSTADKPTRIILSGEEPWIFVFIFWLCSVIKPVVFRLKLENFPWC